jgi:hypothetical protein
VLSLSLLRRVAAAATLLLFDLSCTSELAVPILHLRSAPGGAAPYVRALTDPMMALAAVEAAVEAAVTAELRCCAPLIIA